MAVVGGSIPGCSSLYVKYSWAIESTYVNEAGCTKHFERSGSVETLYIRTIPFIISLEERGIG